MSSWLSGSTKFNLVNLDLSKNVVVRYRNIIQLAITLPFFNVHRLHRIHKFALASAACGTVVMRGKPLSQVIQVSTMLARATKGELSQNCVVAQGTSEWKVLTRVAKVALGVEIDLLLTAWALDDNCDCRRGISFHFGILLRRETHCASKGQSQGHGRFFYQ